MTPTPGAAILGAMPPVDHWPLHARQWHLIGAPLRPGAEDLAVVKEEARRWRRAGEGCEGRALRVLVLGVTPELVTIPWPPGTQLSAVDRCPGMIGAVWPRADAPPGARVTQGEWAALPEGEHEVDLILADGCFSALRFPADYEAVARELARVLAPGGRLVVRAFVPPPRPETVSGVARALWDGHIGSFHAFKWRLAMALQPTPRAGVRLADIWEAWRDLCPDPERLCRERDWDRATVDTIDVYRGSPATYSFASETELRETLAPWFSETRRVVPGYELGDRCPTLIYEGPS